MSFLSWKQCASLISIGLMSIMVIGCRSTPAISEQEKQATIERLYTELAQEFPKIPEITPIELQKLQNQQEVILVDVRSATERTISIIPGAITLKEFEQNIEQFQENSQKKPIIFYCTIGYRSGKYAQQILQKHNLNIYNLKGSLLAWSHAQGELVNDLSTTKKIHVYSPKWQLAADNYQQVW